MRRLRLLYPIFVAIFPVLAFAASSGGRYQLADVLLLIALLGAGTIVAYGVVFLLLQVHLPARGSAASHRADLAAGLVLLGVGCFYLDLPARLAVARWAPALAREPWSYLLMVVVTAGLIGWLWLRQSELASLGRFMTLFTGILVVWSGLQLGANELRAARAAPRTSLAQELSRPVPVPVSRASDRAASQRDIYMVVLDAYANARVLREHFGFDNRAFEDSLRALGFRIPASVRSNYAHSIQSIPSLLNFEHVTALGSVGVSDRDWTFLTYLIEHNRAARFLKAQGYRVTLFPSAWWEPTQRDRYADEQFRAFPEFDLDWELHRTPLRRKVVERSVLMALTRFSERNAADAEHIRRSFEGLKAMPLRPEPTFSFAHVMAPHAPYIVDAACRPRPPVTYWTDGSAGSPKDRRAYVAQLECVNRLTLDLVAALVTRSATPPIIILQGDHGSPASLQPELLPTPEQARERFGAFGAYYLPNGGHRALPDSVTPVNVLRYVFSHYFGADLPPRENALYFSHLNRPHKFFRLDGEYRIMREGQHRAEVAGRSVAGGQ